MPSKTNPIPIQVPIWQLRPLAEGRAKLILVPVDIPGIKPKTIECRGDTATIKTAELSISGKFKYHPNATLYVKEEWAQLPGKPPAFIQRSWLAPDSGDDFKRKADRLLIDRSDWQPAETMPIEAARIWLRISSVCAIQFGQITEEEEELMGWKSFETIPPICGDEDWVWAIKVREISPF
jgi:hypothetical protein